MYQPDGIVAGTDTWDRLVEKESKVNPVPVGRPEPSNQRA